MNPLSSNDHTIDATRYAVEKYWKHSSVELSDRIIIEYVDKHYNIKVKKTKMDRSWIYIMNQYLEVIK